MTEASEDMVHYAFVSADDLGPDRVEVFEGDPSEMDFVGEVPDISMIARVAERVFPGPARHVAEHAIRLFIGTGAHFRWLEEEALKDLRGQKQLPFDQINPDELGVMRVLEDDPKYASQLGPLSVSELEMLERISSGLGQNETGDNKGEQ